MMRGVLDMQEGGPVTINLIRAGEGICEAPEGIATGSFLVQTLLSSRMEGEMTAMRVFVPPGVITHWHQHPRGQLLFVLDGVGRIQRQGREPLELRTGDAVWFAPNERHWHGAAPGSPFSYLSVQAVMDGKAVEWFDPV